MAFLPIPSSPSASELDAIHAALGFEFGEAFTPSLTFATPGNLSVAFSTQLGSYSRVGKLILATVNLITSSFTHTTASGNLQITGLPVASRTLSGEIHYGGGRFGGITKAGHTDLAFAVSSNNSFALLRTSGSGVSPGLVAASDMPSGGNVVICGTFAYLTA